MECVKCGAELKQGCLYCSRCGHEVQIVAHDYSVLEDEYLHELLNEEEKLDAPKNEAVLSVTPKKKKNGKSPVIIICCLISLVICAGIAVKLVVDYQNAHSFDYQFKMAKREAKYGNEENALGYYNTALSLHPQDIDVRMAMSDIYIEQKEYSAAKTLLMEVIQLDAQNISAYKSLMFICEEDDDLETLTELASNADTLEIKELFDGYIVAEPIISPAEGTYEEYIQASVFSLEDFDIYYTLDGTKPDAENGILYDNTKKIPLEKSGKYHIQAVCRNAKGIYSNIAKSSFIINVTAPDYAVVSPDGGRITSETGVFITAEAGCDIYYTWDGTNPTTMSTKYTSPIAIPTGNNILSVLVVNRTTGLDSGVYRTNFIYYP